MRTSTFSCTFAFALLLAACGDDTGGAGGAGSGGGSTTDAASTGTGSTTDASSTGTGSAAVTEVDCAGATIAQEVATDGFAFDPAAITLSAGGIIRFTPGSTIHNIAGEDASWASDFGDTACFQFATAGSYPFVCDAHKPDMAGTIAVN